jgi:hypothetical protein
MLAALLYAAMTQPADQPQGGKPDEVRAHESAAARVPHLQDLCSDLGVALRLSTNKYHAQGEEQFLVRLIRMTDDRLPAYMGV